MNQAVQVVFDTLRNSAAGAILVGYTIVGTPFAHPIRLLVMQNMTDGNVIISFDGVNDHAFLASTGQIVLDFASDASEVAGMWSLPIGAGVWVKRSGAAPANGNFWVTAAYGKGE